MNTDEKYNLIFNSLLNGTAEDWECLAQQFPDFPDGVDSEPFEYGCGEIFQFGRPWIINAIDCAPLECVQWMISKGINLRFVDGEGYSPLHSCIDRELPDRYKVMQMLIDSGADINIGAKLGQQAIESWTPLHMAAHRNDIEAAKMLLRNGADATIKTMIDDFCNAKQTALLAGNKEVAELIKSYDRQKYLNNNEIQNA